MLREIDIDRDVPSLESVQLVSKENDMVGRQVLKPEPSNSRTIKALALIGGAVALALGLTILIPAKAGADEGEWALDPARVVSVYLQCGGKGYLSDHTVIVQKVRNPEGFNTGDLGRIGGQCGNRWTSPDSWVMTLAAAQYQDTQGWPTPGVPVNGRFYYSRSYPQCGGSVGAMDFRPNHTILVNAYTDPATDEKIHSWRDVGSQPGQCGNPQAPLVPSAI